MQFLNSEGVILQTYPFQDDDLLITAFTHREGLAKFILKGANRPKKHPGLSTAPFTVVQFVFSKGKSDLLKCQEVSTIRQHLQLRHSLHSLQAAGEISRATQQAKVFFAPDPDLYLLFTSYLKQISQMQDPFFLSSSFQLKLLLHEGLLPDLSGVFDQEELRLVERMLLFQRYSEITNCLLPKELKQKIGCFFLELIT